MQDLLLFLSWFNESSLGEGIDEETEDADKDAGSILRSELETVGESPFIDL